MDLFVNNSIFSDDSDLNFPDTSFADFNKNAAVVARRMETVRLLSILQWFMKCSSIEKNNYLLRLSKELNLEDLMEVLKPIKLFFGKAFVLNEATNGTVCIDDKVLNDDNINLPTETLSDVQEDDFKWFNNLERINQVKVLIGLIKTVGVGNCRKLCRSLCEMYRLRRAEEEVTTQLNAKLAFEGDIEEQNRDYTSDGNSNDDYTASGEVHLVVADLRKNWSQLITKYRTEVFGKLTATTKKQKKRRQGAVAESPRGRKGRAASDDKNKKRKHLNADNQRLDQLQLLPLYTSLKILGYLDNKTLQTAQQVNPYWLFAAGEVLNERAARSALNKILAKMSERLLSSGTGAEKPAQLSFATAATVDCYSTDGALGHCDHRMQMLFERGTAIPALRRPAAATAAPLGCDSGSPSLLQDVYAQAHFPYGSFVLPTEGMRVLPRCLQPQPAEALLMGAECATQWLEGAPGRIVKKRPIIDQQVVAPPLGRKVEAASTRQSLEFLQNIHDMAESAAAAEHQQYSIIDPNLLQQMTTTIIEQHKSAFSMTVDGPPQHPYDNFQDTKEDVLNDLVSSTRIKLTKGVSAMDTFAVQRPDAEAVLRSFEQRVSEFALRGRIPSALDSNANAAAAVAPSPSTPP